MEEKVFGIPANTLAVSMVSILIVVAVIIFFGAFRRFILVKMGTRNIPRRKGQSSLIVMGLMLSSIIIAVSLGIGDTVRYSVRSVVFDSAGNIVEIQCTGEMKPISDIHFQDMYSLAKSACKVIFQKQKNAFT